MLTPEGCASRRQRLWQQVPEDVETLVLADPQSVIYFANYAPSPFVFRTSDASAVLILERDRSILIGDSMVNVFLEQAHVDEICGPTWYDGKHPAPHRRAMLAKTAVARIGKIKRKCVALEESSVPQAVFEGFLETGCEDFWIGLDTTVRAMRRSKDADEIAVLHRSMRAGEAGHAAALQQARPGMTEHDIYNIIQRAANESVGHAVIVYGDFVAGPRVATERGGPPTSRVIEMGDLLLLDFSVIVHGYRGDFTNTFAVGSLPTQAQRDLFKTCLESLAAAEAVLKPGVLGREVDRAAKAVAEAAGFGHAYKSHTGHGLGLSHPEPPYFVSESDEQVVEGDVVAIEPGLFIEGVGGMRFERNYLVTPAGFENLTHHRLTLEQSP